MTAPASRRPVCRHALALILHTCVIKVWIARRILNSSFPSQLGFVLASAPSFRQVPDHLMCDTPAMLRELKVVERRYQAVLQVLDGIPVAEAAERFGWPGRRCIAGWPFTGITVLLAWLTGRALRGRAISAMPGLFPCGGAGGI